MCKRRFLFLDIDILGPTCQLSLGQERSGEQHRKNTDNLWLRQCFLPSIFDTYRRWREFPNISSEWKNQAVLNAAARLIVRKRKYDSISSTIWDILHWLPIRQRVEFKTCVLVYNWLHKQLFVQHVSASLCQPQPPMPTISCTRGPRRPSHKNSLLRPS